MFSVEAVDNMDIIITIWGIVFLITCLLWWGFESGAYFKAMDEIEKYNLDKKKK